MNESRPRVYLAGPITGGTFADGSSWRTRARANLLPEIDAFSPLRGKDFLASMGVLSSDSYDINPLSTSKGITTRDRMDTTHADLVLMNLLDASRVSIGTMIELGWADAVRVPIILVMEEAGNCHDHAMVREIAGYIVPSLDDAIALTRIILLP